MTPRVFAILVCLFASGRAPRLRYVAAALGCELFAVDAMAVATSKQMIELASLAWLAPSLLVATFGAWLALPSRFVLAAFVGAETIACAVARSGSVAWVALASCAVSAVQLARRTKPNDTERAATLALLVGNVAAFALMLLVGVDDAYASDVVSTSNDLTHLAVAALGLWATRTR